jgi:two-component system, chemotaxis family, chemotaxis protein CheY
MFALVVDDSKATRLILGHILRQIGFQVAEAGNGHEGIEQLKRFNPHVVLIDWNMPDMSGLEFVQAVRADGNYARLRLMMVTSEEDQAQMTRALEAGADEYIPKPFTKEVLLEKLQLLGITPQ